MGFWIFLAVLALLGLWLVTVYNGLVGLRQRVSQAFADIDVQLKQRHDLVPNLVETVKGYATHERGNAGSSHPGPQRRAQCSRTFAAGSRGGRADRRARQAFSPCPRPIRT